MIDRIEYDEDVVELCVYKPTNVKGLIGFDEWLRELYGDDPLRGIRVKPFNSEPPLVNDATIEQQHDEEHYDGKCM